MPELNTGLPKIIGAIKSRSFAKQDVFHNTLDVFEQFRTILEQEVAAIQEKLAGADHQVDIQIEASDNFEVRLKIAGDIILFSMHSNVFNFEDNHFVQQTAYVREDTTRSYCGMISIHNFLADSFKYNRLTDIGYLIARVFINRENHFFVEGHRQLGFLYNDFEKAVINPVYIRAIIEAAIQYSLEFELLVPPFNATREITVQAMQIMSMQAGWRTAKRPGFKFYQDQEGFSAEHEDGNH